MSVVVRSGRRLAPGAAFGTEGEDKPLKYPTIFNCADVAVITKMDLATAVEFDEAAACANIQAVRPGIQVFTVSSKNGAGMEEFFSFLASRAAGVRATTPA
jgi:hydrogenase nickel incorporation protein HypB